MLLAASDSDLSIVGELDKDTTGSSAAGAEGAAGAASAAAGVMRCSSDHRRVYSSHPRRVDSSERVSVASVSSSSFLSAVSSQEDVALVDLHVHLAKPIIECPLLLPSYRSICITIQHLHIINFVMFLTYLNDFDFCRSYCYSCRL